MSECAHLLSEILLGGQHKPDTKTFLKYSTLGEEAVLQTLHTLQQGKIPPLL